MNVTVRKYEEKDLPDLIRIWNEVVEDGVASVSYTHLDVYKRQAMDWAGLFLISFILPAVLCPLINMFVRKLGWVKDGDMTLS